MAKKLKKQRAGKQFEGSLLENPDSIATSFSRGEDFLKKNGKVVGGLIAAGIVIIAGILIFQINKANQNKTAQSEMFQAVYYYEQDSVELALNGDGLNAGFLQIIDDYGGTDAANLSNFYVGSIYLSQGNFQGAIDHLRKFSADDYFVQSKAYALIGDAYMELGQFDEGINYYQRVANNEENKYFTPRYLEKLAIAYEEAGQINQAIATYERIEKEYSDSFEYTAALKHKTRLEGLAAN